MSEQKLKNYRGIAPAHLICVLEGNGEDIPFQEVKYVVEYETIAGLTRLRTLGKVVELTEQERYWF